MLKPIIAFALVPVLLFSCNSPQPVTPKTSEVKKFHLPVILQDSLQDKAFVMEGKTINPMYFPIMGKYQFCDTLKLPNEGHHKDATKTNDILYEKSYLNTRDSLNTDGFQIFADYKTSIHYRQDSLYRTFVTYFPVYIVNETENTKIFFAKDQYAWGVQEVKDTSDYDHWYAIECKGWDFCGYGHFGIKVRPKEFILILVPRYKGNQTGDMRVRIQVDNSTYVSLPYEGTYHLEQLYFDKADFNLELVNHYLKSGIYGAAFKQPGKR